MRVVNLPKSLLAQIHQIVNSWAVENKVMSPTEELCVDVAAKVIDVGHVIVVDQFTVLEFDPQTVNFAVRREYKLFRSWDQKTQVFLNNFQPVTSGILRVKIGYFILKRKIKQGVLKDVESIMASKGYRSIDLGELTSLPVMPINAAGIRTCNLYALKTEVVSGIYPVLMSRSIGGVFSLNTESFRGLSAENRIFVGLKEVSD